jgi:ACS family D-galactonate transporter-like MFS transporter
MTYVMVLNKRLTMPQIMLQQETMTSRVRYVVLALISIGTMINYLDRTILGIAAPALTEELGINAAVMGIIFSAFSWSYTAMQIPGGILLDKIGSRIIYFISLTLWSFFTVLHGLVNNVWTLMAMRLGLGVAEAPCFPTNSRIVATWFPQQERAMATGVYTVGEYIGLAFLSPVLFWILASYGWRVLFIIIGIVGIIFGFVWIKFYREPHDHKTVSQSELDYIAQGGGIVTAPANVIAFEWNMIFRLLKYRQLSGICLGQFASNSTLVFFLTWFPTYLATERQMEWIKIGFFTFMPFISASVGVLFGGWLSDFLLRQGKSVNLARKLPIIIGLILASTIIGANYVDSNLAVIAILSVAFFSQGMAALGWTLVSDIAPAGQLGLTGGIFNFAANLAGIITPMVIGFIVAATGSFIGAIFYVGLLALVGAISYIFIVGDVQRIVLE